MSFVINFWYEPAKHKNNITSGKTINWKSFKENKTHYFLVSKGSNLILKTKSGTILDCLLSLDPAKKHMLVLASDDKMLTVYLDGNVIKQVKIPKQVIAEKTEPKKITPKKQKVKQSKTSKVKLTKPKTAETKKATPKKKGPKRLKPKKIIL